MGRDMWRLWFTKLLPLAVVLFFVCVETRSEVATAVGAVVSVTHRRRSRGKGLDKDAIRKSDEPVSLSPPGATRLFKMTPNLFGSLATLHLKASQRDVHQEKSTTGKPANTQTLLVQKSSSKPRHERKIVWRNVLAFAYLHLACLYGVYLCFVSTKVVTILWSIFLTFVGGMGITAGAHRLWAHKTYKAKWPMRLMLMIFQTIGFQNHIYEWVRDHRMHHTYTDTDADPHNSQRGFFFSHMGWLLVRKHPDVKTKGATIDMSDLENDPIVVWQRRLYIILVPLLSFAIPAMVPYYFWSETLLNSWHTAMARYTYSLHCTWLVNSAAHMWGMKPYEKTISPTDNMSVAILVFGEGWHNYHHVFPWDYKTAELGNYSMNVTTAFIDLCAKLGLAYDLKTVPVDMIRKRATRTGDGTRYKKRSAIHEHSHKVATWGWGNPDLTPEEIQETEIINKRF